MSEKMPKDPSKNGKIIHFDFKEKKIIPDSNEILQPRIPEITMEEAKKIFQDVFDNFEPQVWQLCGLVEKAKEKFTAYKHLISSAGYSEGRYRGYVSQQQPHRLGSKSSKGKEVFQIFSEDENLFYGKIYEYENELKEYIENFLIKRESMEKELHDAYTHLKNFQGAEDIKEKLEKYIEKVGFDYVSLVLAINYQDDNDKKIEMMEKFAKKLVN